jgi:hypothetical protein
MSAFDRIYSGLKAVMLMDERFDRIDSELRGLSQDFSGLAASHADLAQRVAAIEGYIRGRSDQAATQARLPKD